jgi:hypothetical protein
MTPRLRKAALTAHIVFSIGWLGAIVPYLALAIAGLTSGDAQMARAAFVSMEVIGWFVIVPFSLAALLSGLVQALGTQWGLFRHWWVLAKFMLSVVATVILLAHMQDVSRVARVAKEATFSSADFQPELIHAGGGLLVLLAITALSVFKPWGMTPWGSRVSQTDSLARPSESAVLVHEPALTTGTPFWVRVVGFHAIGIALLFVIILHLTGGGFRH